MVGGAVIVVAAIIALATGALAKPQTSVTPRATDPTGLAMCGTIPCPSKGDPNAPVTMIEVSDYGCSHCRDYAMDIEPLIEEQYIKTGKVRYVVHSFGLAPGTQSIAATALCAWDQGKFWEYHKALFENQGKFDPADLALYAQQVGMDTQQFATCVNSGKYVADVSTTSNAARAAGVTGTPSFFINRKMVIGALPFSCAPSAPECQLGSFQSHIEAALKGSQ